MAVTTAAPTKTSLWESFDGDSAYLYDQYLDVPYERTTGASPDDLVGGLDELLVEHEAQPHVLTKAQAMAHLLARGQIHVDPRDPFPDKLNHGGALRLLRERWHAQASSSTLAADTTWFDTLGSTGAGRGALDTGHISPGWQKIFSRGLGALGEEARERAAPVSSGDHRRQAFYDAVSIVCEAAILLSHRFAAHAEKMVRDHPLERDRLTAIATMCYRIPECPPQTLHEALYCAWLMHELIEMEGEAVRSLGRLDLMFYPYYQADLASGRLTRAETKALLKYYWIKSTARTRGVGNGAHFCLGGQLSDGRDATNELTYLILEAYEELNAPDPKLSVRFHAESPQPLFDRVLGLVRDGHNAIVLMNDEAAVPALVKRGKGLEDARSYLPIGCYEPAVDGKEAACTTNLVINLAKPVELVLHRGVDPLSGAQVGVDTGDPDELGSFDRFLQAYLTQLDHILERSAQTIAGHERHWSRINPSPLIAATIDDCLERGLDIGEGGAHYNAVGCVGAGLANAADSLLAVKHAIYSGSRFTIQELIEALEHDFQGHEPMRQYLANAVPKWGNGDSEADALSRQVAQHYCEKIHSFVNERGGPYQAALYSFTFQWTLGSDTGALPDGRKAHMPLAPGVGAMAGRDRSGVTGVLESVSGLDFYQTPNGSVLDVRLHPSSVRGQAGIEAMTSLVKTFFKKGADRVSPGYALQFDVVEAETLCAAQRNPEAYRTLQVRVAGYSAYFVQLSTEMQDHLIAQGRHSL